MEEPGTVRTGCTGHFLSPLSKPERAAAQHALGCSARRMPRREPGPDASGTTDGEKEPETRGARPATSLPPGEARGRGGARRPPGRTGCPGRPPGPAAAGLGQGAEGCHVLWQDRGPSQSLGHCQMPGRGPERGSHRRPRGPCLPSDRSEPRCHHLPGLQRPRESLPSEPWFLSLGVLERLLKVGPPNLFLPSGPYPEAH